MKNLIITLMILPIGVLLAQKNKVGITAEEYSLMGKKVSAIDARVAVLEQELEEIKARYQTQNWAYSGEANDTSSLHRRMVEIASQRAEIEDKIRKNTETIAIVGVVALVAMGIGILVTIVAAASATSSSTDDGSLTHRVLGGHFAVGTQGISWRGRGVGRAYQPAAP